MAGKKSGDSESKYLGKTNPAIINKVLDNPRVHYPKNRKKWKVPSYYLRYFNPTKGVIHITANPLKIPKGMDKPRFLSFIRTFEENNNIRLCDMSKNELLYSFLDFVEHTNSVIALKDDSRQFVPYRFKFPDVMKLYLYKAFYPEIFDYDIVHEGKQEVIKFKSTYIEENFHDIYIHMEFLFTAMLYDALLIAIERYSLEQINSMKTYNVDIDPGKEVPDLLEDLKGWLEPGTNKEEFHDPREKILHMFIPSIIFFSKFHYFLYEKREISKVLITTTMKYGSLYKGNRAVQCRSALKKALKGCYKLLNKKPFTFYRLLNLYHINRKTGLFDLQITKENVDFKPYLFDGILAKHLINEMITSNSIKLENYSTQFEDYDCSSQRFDKSLALSSVHNNPNCIADNLTTRDYETIDFIISSAAKSMQVYYLTEEEKEVPPSLACDFLDWISKEGYTKEVVAESPVLKKFNINNIDFENVMFFNQLKSDLDD